VLPFIQRTEVKFGLRFSEQVKNAIGAGNNDMTVDQVREFNAKHAAPPREYHIQFQDHSGNISNVTLKNPRYYSTSGKADLDGNHALEDNEAAPYVAIIARFNWKRIRAVQSFTVDKNSQGQTVVLEDNSILPLENDTAVSVRSARYPRASPEEAGFEEIGSYPANHASILCPLAGTPAFCPGGPPNAIIDPGSRGGSE